MPRKKKEDVSGQMLLDEFLKPEKPKKKRKTMEDISSSDSSKEPVWGHPDKYMNPPEEAEIMDSDFEVQAQKVLAEYQIMTTGCVMRCCRSSSKKADEILQYMLDKKYIEPYKKVPGKYKTKKSENELK